MRKCIYGAILVVLAWGLPQVGSLGQQPKGANELMRKKLEHAQKVLEGLALNDFDKIAKNSEELLRISKAVAWKVVKSPQYEVQSNAFRGSVDSLIQRANEKNLDGAALAYVDMTLGCVKCHKHVREIRMTRLDGE